MLNRPAGYLVAIAVLATVSLNTLHDALGELSRAHTAAQHAAMWTDFAFAAIGITVTLMALPSRAFANPVLPPLRLLWALALIASAVLGQMVWQLESHIPSAIASAVVGAAVAWVVLRFSRPVPVAPS